MLTEPTSLASVARTLVGVSVNAPSPRPWIFRINRCTESGCRPPRSARSAVVARVLVAILLLVFVGCSSGNTADSTTTSRDAGATSTTSTAEPTTTTVSTTRSTTSTTVLPLLELEITDPEDGQIVDAKSYVFTGTITPGATITVGSFQATVDDGTWRIRLSLNQGANLVTFVASDRLGQELIEQVQVFYEIDDDGLKPGSP